MKSLVTLLSAKCQCMPSAIVAYCLVLKRVHLSFHLFKSKEEVNHIVRSALAYFLFSGVCSFYFECAEIDYWRIEVVLAEENALMGRECSVTLT